MSKYKVRRKALMDFCSEWDEEIETAYNSDNDSDIQVVVDIARHELGYSDRTWYQDIWAVIRKAWEDKSDKDV